MLFKSTLALAFVALANVAAAAQTPACVLKVMGNTDNPADLKSICGSDSKKIISNLEDACGGKSDSALKFFSNTCKEHGHEVDVSSSSDSTTTTTGTSGSASATGSGFVTAASTSGSQATSTSGSSSSSESGSASGGSSGSATGSGSGSSSAPSATPSTAGAIDRFEHLSGSAFVAALFVGAAALL